MSGESLHEGIQVMHELTIDGYRMTVFKKSGEFVLTWVMEPLEALEMGSTMLRTLGEHYEGVIKIVKDGSGE